MNIEYDHQDLVTPGHSYQRRRGGHRPGTDQPHAEYGFYPDCYPPLPQSEQTHSEFVESLDPTSLPSSRALSLSWVFGAALRRLLIG